MLSLSCWANKICRVYESLENYLIDRTHIHFWTWVIRELFKWFYRHIVYGKNARSKRWYWNSYIILYKFKALRFTYIVKKTKNIGHWTFLWYKVEYIVKLQNVHAIWRKIGMPVDKGNIKRKHCWLKQFNMLLFSYHIYHALGSHTYASLSWVYWKQWNTWHYGLIKIGIGCREICDYWKCLDGVKSLN
jgi:hypothetical protein